MTDHMRQVSILAYMTGRLAQKLAGYTKEDAQDILDEARRQAEESCEREAERRGAA